MAEDFSLKLIVEKGPREGETLTYSTRSLVKIGRVARGNTIAIKDEGVSSKHLCIQFDNNLSKWTLCDLDSSNGTFLNGQILKPYVPSGLEDGDCIKIGELTSMVVKVDVESFIQPRRNPRRQVKSSATGAGSAAVVENEIANHVVSIKPRMTRGRKKMSVQVLEDHSLDVSKPADTVVPIAGKRTLASRKRLPVEENLNLDLNNVNESSQLDEGTVTAFDKLSKDSLKNVQNSTLGKNLDTNNESAQEQVVDEGSSKGKEVAEESECRKDGCEGSVKETGPDNGRWLDLEKMTLSDFFDYMEVQLIQEINEKIEKTISDLKEKDRKCHEFRLQWNEKKKD